MSSFICYSYKFWTILFAYSGRHPESLRQEAVHNHHLRKWAWIQGWLYIFKVIFLLPLFLGSSAVLFINKTSRLVFLKKMYITFFNASSYYIVKNIKILCLQMSLDLCRSVYIYIPVPLSEYILE